MPVVRPELSWSVRVRRALGWAIVLSGALAAINWAVESQTAGGPRMQGALMGGLVAALATALGTLPVLLSQQFSQRAHDAMLGFGAGVMLAACSFSLIIPGLAHAEAGPGDWTLGGRRSDWCRAVAGRCRHDAAGPACAA